MREVCVAGCFDDLRPPQVRFLQEAAGHGPLTIFLRDDASAAALLGHAPKFSFDERRYFIEALRWVGRVEAVGLGLSADALPSTVKPGSLWAMVEEDCAILPSSERASRRRLAACRSLELEPLVLGETSFAGFPYAAPPIVAPSDGAIPGRERVIVTGSFDWLHTGHVRFFEEAAAYGELTVVVGHDANIRLLKGEGHPLVPEAERLYMVASIRYVARALVSTGSGWLDAEPEIRLLRPDRYVVNADGDKEEKRRYCAEKGIRYTVLAREPRPGLPRRSSTDLRGF